MRIAIMLPLAALALALGCGLAAEASAKAAAAPDPRQKTDLKVLDGEIARFDALAATVTDRGERATVKAFLDGFKDRREALRAAYNRDTYLELRWEIDVEYQRLVSWLAPPATPAEK